MFVNSKVLALFFIHMNFLTLDFLHVTVFVMDFIVFIIKITEQNENKAFRFCLDEQIMEYFVLFLYIGSTFIFIWFIIVRLYIFLFQTILFEKIEESVCYRFPCKQDRKIKPKSAVSSVI
jgi:hypothetical protein